MKMSAKEAKRWNASVSQGAETGCWLWSGRLTDKGYGLFYWRGREWRAHRVSLLLAGRPAQDGLDVDHLCRVRNCVNPDHLEAVTHRENVVRGMGPIVAGERHSSKTHCPHGHPYSGDNLRMCPRGYRRCRQCETDQNRKRQNAHE